MRIENSFEKSFRFKSLLELLKSNPNEQDCIDFLKWWRWKGKTPISPYDPNSKVYKFANNRYRCKNTGKDFNVKTGTIFKNSKISLLNWFRALHHFLSGKQGKNSCELARNIHVTQKTAYSILKELRNVSNVQIFREMLEGVVEVDETYVGGKNKNRHWNKKVPHSQGRSWKDKIPTIVMVARGGNAIARVVSNVKKATSEAIIRANIKEGSTVYTDEWHAYKDLGKWYNHDFINHRIKQYKKGDSTTNLAESFNNCLKRTIRNYHWISRKHSQGYMNEIAFRFNTRKWSMQASLDLLLSATIIS